MQNAVAPPLPFTAFLVCCLLSLSLARWWWHVIGCLRLRRARGCRFSLVLFDCRAPLPALQKRCPIHPLVAHPSWGATYRICSWTRRTCPAIPVRHSGSRESSAPSALRCSHVAAAETATSARGPCETRRAIRTVKQCSGGRWRDVGWALTVAVGRPLFDCVLQAASCSCCS